MSHNIERSKTAFDGTQRLDNPKNEDDIKMEEDRKNKDDLTFI